MKTKDEKKPKAENIQQAQRKTIDSVKAESVEKKQQPSIHPLDALIENIKVDRILLEEQEKKLAECKQAKTDIASRLKDYKSDLKVFLKYATEEQKEAIAELGLETSSSTQTVNLVVESTLKIMQEHKKLTNEQLFEKYVSAVPKGQTPETYTFFNIKIRSLFNRQILTKAIGEDPSSSRTDVITLNESKTE